MTWMRDIKKNREIVKQTGNGGKRDDRLKLWTDR
jgi:hypothetical protein